LWRDVILEITTTNQLVPILYKNTPIFNIGEDAFAEIISYLDTGFVFTKFVLVCRYFFGVAIKKSVLNLSGKSFRCFSKAPSYIQKLQFNSLRSFGRKNFCPVKKLISLDRDKISSLKKLILVCPSNCRETIQLPNMPNLTFLDYEGHHLITNLENFSTLITLNIRVNNDDQFINLTESLPNFVVLKNLRLMCRIDVDELLIQRFFDEVKKKKFIINSFYTGR